MSKQGRQDQPSNVRTDYSSTLPHVQNATTSLIDTFSKELNRIRQFCQNGQYGKARAAWRGMTEQFQTVGTFLKQTSKMSQSSQFQGQAQIDQGQQSQGRSQGQSQQGQQGQQGRQRQVINSQSLPSDPQALQRLISAASSKLGQVGQRRASAA